MKQLVDKRPLLNSKISIQDFRDFYWLKKELSDFCRKEGLRTTGGKIEIADRIEHYLKTGTTKKERATPMPKSTSSFDWNTEKLSQTTIITDNYKNTENVRIFFQQEIGKHFKFNVKFMNWMKSNVGKTLKEAIIEWNNIRTASKKKSLPKEIAPQFEYNTYLRDFLADNPGAKRKTGILLWKKKKAMRGDNVYHKEDLNMLW